MRDWATYRLRAIAEPNVVDRMLDGVQTRARCKHPSGKDALYFALQRHFINFDKSVSIGRLGRRSRVTGAGDDLQGAKLHCFSDRRVKRDRAPGDFVETGEHRTRILNLLCRRLGDNRVVGARRGIDRLLRRRIRGCGYVAILRRGRQ